MSHDFLTTGRPSILAHRGASRRNPPGNTLEAFRAAIDSGCDHIETDVQVTRDGVVVIFHDEQLDDVTTGSGRIGDLDWSELLEVRYLVDGQPSDEALLRLDQAIRQFPAAFFNIDVKTDESVGPTAGLLERSIGPGRVCIAAFSHRRLRRLRSSLGDQWCSAFAKSEIVIARLAAWLRLPVPRFGDVVQTPERWKGIRVVDRTFVQACHTAGLAVHVWTINDPDDAERLWSMGVDALITDVPERFIPSDEV